MKFAHIEGEKLLGWYDPELHTSIPTPNIEVTDDVWQQAINQGANAYVSGVFTVKNFVTKEQLNQMRIQELKLFLAKTDYKDLPSYDKRGTSEWQEVMNQRQAWREEIRNLEV